MGEWQGTGFPIRDVGHHQYRWGAADHRLPAQATLTGRRVRGNGRVHCGGLCVSCGKAGVRGPVARARGMGWLHLSAQKSGSRSLSIASAAGRKAAWRATEAAILTIHKNPQTAVFTVLEIMVTVFSACAARKAPNSLPQLC